MEYVTSQNKQSWFAAKRAHLNLLQSFKKNIKNKSEPASEVRGRKVSPLLATSEVSVWLW